MLHEHIHLQLYAIRSNNAPCVLIQMLLQTTGMPRQHSSKRSLAGTKLVPDVRKAYMALQCYHRPVTFIHIASRLL